MSQRYTEYLKGSGTGTVEAIARFYYTNSVFYLLDDDMCLITEQEGRESCPALLVQSDYIPT